MQGQYCTWPASLSTEDFQGDGKIQGPVGPRRVLTQPACVCSHSGTGRLWWVYSRIKWENPFDGIYLCSVFKTLTNQEHFQTPANPMHLELDLAQHWPHSQVSCSLSPGWGQRGMVSPASSNHPAQPWCLHHEGEVNASVTCWCHPHRVVSPPGTLLTKITIKQVSCQPQQL